jgi:hypothetical protein
MDWLRYKVYGTRCLLRNLGFLVRSLFARPGTHHSYRRTRFGIGMPDLQCPTCDRFYRQSSALTAHLKNCSELKEDLNTLRARLGSSKEKGRVKEKGTKGPKAPDWAANLHIDQPTRSQEVGAVFLTLITPIDSGADNRSERPSGKLFESSSVSRTS